MIRFTQKGSRTPLKFLAATFLAGLTISLAQDSSNVFQLRNYPDVSFLLGEGFIARGLGGQALSVELVGNFAGHVGMLYFLDPVTGQERELFRNKDNPGTRVELGNFPKGAPIVFKYHNESGHGSAVTGFTGSNTPENYDFAGQPELESLAIHGKPKPVSPKSSSTGDRRWAIAGRTGSDEVVFGFEDLTSGKPDYDDIIFLVRGVLLDSEVKLSAPGGLQDSHFTGSLTVILTAGTGADNAGAILFYTLDGSAPVFDSTGSPLGTTRVYNQPLILTGTTHVQVQAWKPTEVTPEGTRRYTPSEVVSGHYIHQRVQARSGAYLDRDGDGRIDAISLTFDSLPLSLPARLQVDDPLASGRTLELDGDALAMAEWSGTTARLPLLHPLPFGTVPSSTTEGRFAPGTIGDTLPFPMLDSAGPQLVAAEAFPQTFTLDGAPIEKPKLVAKFSEAMHIDLSSTEFPFILLRLGLPLPSGAVTVSAVRPLGSDRYEYTFSSSTYPVAGDSLRLLSSPMATDAPGNRSNMALAVAVTGEPLRLPTDLEVKGGPYVVGDKSGAAGPLRIPVFVVAPGETTALPGICLDCATGEWMTQDPSRPDIPSVGPYVDITARWPFSFDLALFTNLGEFVNRAQASITPEMLAMAPKDAQGKHLLRIVWHPVSADGTPMATGAYIAKGMLIPETDSKLGGPQGEKVEVEGRPHPVLVRLGYVKL